MFDRDSTSRASAITTTTEPSTFANRRNFFELSTEDPGLAVDENEETLGTSLVLPPWAEEDREMIESQLPPIDVPSQESDDG